MIRLGSRRIRITTLAAIAVAAVVWHASQRVPVGPQHGFIHYERLTATGDNATKPVSLRLGTYNIHGGKGTDGKVDLNRIAEVIRPCNFVGLNEVNGPLLWEELKDDQANKIGRLLNVAACFNPAEQRWYHHRFGNGFLTREVVNHWQCVPIQRIWGKSFRNFVHVRLLARNNVTVNIVVAHLDRSDDHERHHQLRCVFEFFLSLATPAVMLGDLNSDVDDIEMRFFMQSPGVVDALAKKFGDQTPRHIDWILTRGVDVVDAGITEPGPSDHPHVWADVIVPPAKVAIP